MAARADLSLTLLPLLFLATLASALLQVSIDCGASQSYTDKKGINWVTDESYISTGQSETIKVTDSVAEPLKTLRVFASRKKNCYTIPVKGDTQVRMQASFNYGNYDGKSSPPTFELLFDGNNFASVETSMDGEIVYEAIYVVTGGSTSVCVAQINQGQLPFVSTIQVWELEKDMYGQFDPSNALYLVSRVAFGASKEVRYPDDAYDRSWDPAQISNSTTVLTSDATSIDTNNTDKPPAAVLKTAITPSDPTHAITLSTGLPSDTAPIYINLYFAEPAKLGSNDTRSFAIFVDGSQLSDPIVPEYASVSEYYIVNVTASASTQFSLQPTLGSSLPPIINAMEVYVVSYTLSNGTDATDVKALKNMISEFDVLKDWSGDPCLPQNYSWDWVGCSSDDSPRVTALYLNGYGLSGQLPDFNSLDALETIDLHNNSISGAIPEFLGKLPSLKELNLADNSFSGPIPSSLSNNNKIKLVTSGNQNLCASGQSCQVISSPANSPPGTKKSHLSHANKKRDNLKLFFGLIAPIFFLAIVH